MLIRTNPMPNESSRNPHVVTPGCTAGWACRIRPGRHGGLVPFLAIWLTLMAVPALAAPKASTQIPSIQAPAAQAAPKSPTQIPSIQAPSQPAGSAAPSVQPAGNAKDVPVMVPVATTQRELSSEAQRNFKLLTGENSLEARQIGAAGLLQQGSAAVTALRQVLSSQPLPIVVQAVALAIPEIKDPPGELIDPLIQQLAADSPNVRSAVIAALISYRDHDVSAKLRTVAANLQNSQPTRLAAVAVLSQLADRDSIETLIDLLETSDELVRRDSLTALTQLTDADYGFEVQQWRRWWLNNRNRPPREWTKAVITSLREEHRNALEEVKSLRAQLAKAQQQIYYLSKEVDRPKQIITCLTHSVPEVRLVGVDLVNMLIPMMDRKSIAPEVADQLPKLINDPDPQVRLQTVGVLGDLRNSEDAKLLLDALNSETDPAISQAITRALGLLHNTAAVPVLLEKLNKGNGPLAAASAAGLSILCQKPDRAVTPQQLDQVVAALKVRMESATDKMLRQAILDAMARIADERFREQFLLALQSQDSALRQSAIKAFADLNGPEDAEKVLAPQLADPEAVVREAVCAALGKVGGPTQLGLLLQRCDDQAEPNLAVRRAAEDAAVAIMLHMDQPALRKELERLIGIPGQVLSLAAVLEKARIQVAGPSSDSMLQAVLLRSLAAAKLAAGLKDARKDAADLWVQVILIEPTDAATIGMLAQTLVEMSSPDVLVGAVQLIASNQSGALAGVLAALNKEYKAAAGNRPADLATALHKIDMSGWSQPNQEALRNLLETCAGTTGGTAKPSAARENGPSPAPAAASAPASMTAR